jgi:hypothetical protein
MIKRVNFVLYGMKVYRGVEVQCHVLLTLAVHEGEQLHAMTTLPPGK